MVETKGGKKMAKKEMIHLALSIVGVAILAIALTLVGFFLIWGRLSFGS